MAIVRVRDRFLESSAWWQCRQGMSHAHEFAEFSTQRSVRARKHHRCSACRETIPAGALYTRVALIGDGTAETIKQCARCRAIFEAICDQFPQEPIDCALDCGETWEDVIGPCPPEIAALAFMLPHEHGPDDIGRNHTQAGSVDRA
jgi:hypothetical protein